MARTTKFFTQFDRPAKEQFLEVNSGELLAEQSYVPVSKMIETMTEAGVRLAEHKKMYYHFGPEEEVPDDFIDLTIQPGIEPADVQALQEDLQASMDEKAKQAVAEENSKTVEKSVPAAKPESSEKEPD